MENKLDLSKIASVVIEEYKSAISIFHATVDRYYKMFATILTVASVFFWTLYHYKISVGFVVFIFLFLSFLSLESYLRFTAAANALYTEYLEKKINFIFQNDVLEWYHKGTHGKYLLTPQKSFFSLLFFFRYIPFVLLFTIFMSLSLYESYVYIVELGSNAILVFNILTSIGLISVVIFNLSFSSFLKKYRGDLDKQLLQYKETLNLSEFKE